MSKTKIEWSEEVWNPTTGCDRVSPGCAHCYALTMAARLKTNPKMQAKGLYQVDGGKASGPGFGIDLHPDRLEAPFKWREPRRVFVNSMSDLFHENIPFDFIDQVFAVMALTPQHTYQVLTKRPERMRTYLNDKDLWFKVKCAASKVLEYEPGAFMSGWPQDHVWLGVTVENQRWADERIPILLDTPAAVRFVSAEPLLGPVSFVFDTEVGPLSWLKANDMKRGDHFDSPGLDWVIVGGESGPKHRPFDHDWARSIVTQCSDAGVACFVKQLGGARPGNRLVDLPEDLRVREYPS